jgi:hypothetical protein
MGCGSTPQTASTRRNEMRDRYLARCESRVLAHSLRHHDQKESEEKQKAAGTA